MEKFWLVLLIAAVMGLGFTSHSAFAMASKHPTAAVVEEETGVETTTPEAAGLDRIMAEDEAVAVEEVKLSKPKDHPAH